MLVVVVLLCACVGKVRDNVDECVAYKFLLFSLDLLPLAFLPSIFTFPHDATHSLWPAAAARRERLPWTRTRLLVCRGGVSEKCPYPRL